MAILERKVMNDRQRRLASYLLLQKTYTSQLSIMAEMPEYNGNMRLLRRDIRELNNGEFSMIICSNADGYKIATKEEAQEYYDIKRKTALRMLALAEKVHHKLQNNGQAKVNNADNVVEVKTVCEK